jgi:hypothetical protein
MDDDAVRALMSTVELISTNLDTRPESWREQLQAIRSTTTSLEILDASPDETRKRWQLPLVSVFQRVAFGDADNGAVQDVADWCLRQALVLLHLYPEDVEVLACEYHPFCYWSSLTTLVIGRNWLLRAQKSLANVYRAERGSSSSSGASASNVWGHEGSTARSIAGVEQLLHTADYVEARGILLPAIEYLQRAVDSAHSQGTVTGALLVTVSCSWIVYRQY